MGVFGQIYGSRVVVGLATPSKGQLGAIAESLISMNKSIYGKFAKNRIAAANINKTTAAGELDTARQQLKEFQDKSGKAIAKGVETTRKQIRAVPMGSEAALEAAGKITRIQKEMSEKNFDMEPAIFKGFDKHIGNVAKLKNLLTALSKEDIAGQQKSLNWMQNRHKVQVLVEKKQTKLHKQGKITSTQLQKHVELTEEYAAEAVEWGIAVGANIRTINKLKSEEQKLIDVEKEKEAALKKVTLTYDELFKKVQKGMKIIAKKTREVILQLKEGFTEALTETTIALTAFYYKLQQNTQELILFERELLNANSVFNITRSELFDTGEAITQFGQQFGMEMQNGATGLYQLASAGLSANDALTVLPETLKLSMAVQGDHNTISKLTAQTIMGFGMDFSETALLVDKFAHAIQKSLIEYQDLSSAVKFALPFFTATGQSIDQLLGALEILTNRALEAGIAGRGLRQALSEFAEHADDNAAAFRKMGVEILNTDGTMRQLTEIAADYASKIGPEAAHNTELLTSMIQDLNVRGATAFIHLVQSSDEFTESVEALENAGGELDEMVKIQNQSLQAQIQILKNNVSAIFLMRDATYEGTDYMNAFHEAVSKLVEQFQSLLVVETEQGYVLSEFGKQLQDIAISGVRLFVELAAQLVEIIKNFTTEGTINLNVLKLYTVPLTVIMKAFDALGPNMQRTVIYLHMLNKLIPFQAIAMMIYSAAYVKLNWAKLWGNVEDSKSILLTKNKIPLDAISSTQKKKEVITLGAFLTLQKKRLVTEYKRIIQRWTEIYQVGFMGNLKKTRLWQEGARIKQRWSEIWQNLTLTKLKEKEYFQGVRSILQKTYQLTLEPIISFFRKLELKERLGIIAGKIWENMLTFYSIVLKGIQIGLYLILAAVILAVAATLFFITIPMLLYTAYMAGMTLGTILFWIAVTGGLIIVAVVIAAMIVQFYEMTKELGFVGAITSIVTDKFTAWGDKVREIWEEKIYPFIYHVGMEFRALFGVLGLQISEWWAILSENKYFQMFSSGITKIAGIVKYVLMIPILVLIATFKILWVSILLVIDVFKALKNLSISGLKDAYKGFVGGIGSAISDLWEDLKFWAEGGYIKMQVAGGATAPMNIVGERGPELFIPNQSGQIINTRRTQEILHDIKRRAGATTGMAGAQTMRVQTLIANNSVNKKTRMSVDTFAGVV